MLACSLSSSQALTLIVWDTEMQTKVGWGKSQNDKFLLSVLPDYDGPVIAVFSPSDKEKANNSYSKLKNRYNGQLKKSKLSLELVTTDSTTNNAVANRVIAQTSKSSSTNRSNKTNIELVSLEKLLKPFGLSIVKVPPNSDNGNNPNYPNNTDKVVEKPAPQTAPQSQISQSSLKVDKKPAVVKPKAPQSPKN